MRTIDELTVEERRAYAQRAKSIMADEAYRLAWHNARQRALESLVVLNPMDQDAIVLAQALVHAIDLVNTELANIGKAGPGKLKEVI